MGTALSVQTTINNLTTEIKHTVEQNSSAHSDANCEITVENISIKKNYGCSFKFLNQCSATAWANADNMIKAVENFHDKLDNDQKQHAAALFSSTFGVSTTVNNIKKKFEQQVKQSCLAEAEVMNKINMGIIEFDECHSTAENPVHIEFTNYGTAASTCVSKLIEDMRLTSVNEAATKQSQGLDWAKLIWPIALVFIVSSVGYVFLKLFINKMPTPEDQKEINNSKFDNYSQRIKTLLKTKEL